MRRVNAWPGDFWVAMEKMVYFVLFPALLFNSIVKTRLALAVAGPTMLVAVSAVLFAIALAYSARWWLKPEPLRFASGVQCGFRFNSYVALAMAQSVAGEPGVALCALVMGVTVPVANLAAVYPLARHSGNNFFKEVLKNPLILATTAGLLANSLGVVLPTPISLTLSKMGAAALALGLIAVGAGLKLERKSAQHDWPFTLWIQFVKSAALPSFALYLAYRLQLGHLERSIITVFAAVPTASTCYILATRMGGDGPYVAFLITLSVLISLVGLPFWLSLL
jgi:malonate transporter and related proteins